MLLGGLLPELLSTFCMQLMVVTPWITPLVARRILPVILPVLLPALMLVLMLMVDGGVFVGGHAALPKVPVTMLADVVTVW